MRIAVTTSSDANPYAATLIGRLSDTSLPPCLLLSTQRSRPGMLGEHLRREGVAAVVRRIMRRRRSRAAAGAATLSELRVYARTHGLSHWDAPLSHIRALFGFELVRVPGINSNEAVAAVRRHRIDVVINAGGGIFRRPMLDAPRIGILNAHMGALPEFRGMNALEWSLYQGVPPCVTVHFIDRGLDTGGILASETIPVQPGDTIAGLRARSLVLNVELILQVVRKLASGGLVPKPQDLEMGKQYFVMHPRLKAIAEARLRRFVSVC